MRRPPAALIDATLWGVSFTLLAAVIAMSLLTPTGGRELPSDKHLHFGAYAALTASFLLAAVWNPWLEDARFPRGRWAVAVALVAVGAAIELVQLARPDRSPELADAVANAAGAGAGLVAWHLLRAATRRS